jgi:hypothetical protein
LLMSSCSSICFKAVTIKLRDRFRWNFVWLFLLFFKGEPIEFESVQK